MRATEEQIGDDVRRFQCYMRERHGWSSTLVCGLQNRPRGETDHYVYPDPCASMGDTRWSVEAAYDRIINPEGRGDEQ